jgi:hypothetical protein
MHARRVINWVNIWTPDVSIALTSHPKKRKVNNEQMGGSVRKEEVEMDLW